VHNVTFHVEGRAGRRADPPREIQGGRLDGPGWASTATTRFEPYLDLLPESGHGVIHDVKAGFGAGQRLSFPSCSTRWPPGSGRHPAEGGELQLFVEVGQAASNENTIRRRRGLARRRRVRGPPPPPRHRRATGAADPGKACGRTCVSRPRRRAKAMSGRNVEREGMERARWPFAETVPGRTSPKPSRRAW